MPIACADLGIILNGTNLDNFQDDYIEYTTSIKIKIPI
jgi:hypothetical protein